MALFRVDGGAKTPKCLPASSISSEFSNLITFMRHSRLLGTVVQHLEKTPRRSATEAGRAFLAERSPITISIAATKPF